VQNPCFLQTLAMSAFQSGDQHVRNRKLRTQDEGPPVPPKTFKTVNTSKPFRRVAAPAPLNLQRESKPLPLLPRSPVATGLRAELQSKPLPLPPKSVTLRSTLLWVAALFLWFLLIVVLLPVITEKDAMPGFNRWLSALLRLKRYETSGTRSSVAHH
jgi:hypothetical protein